MELFKKVKATPAMASAPVAAASGAPQHRGAYAHAAVGCAADGLTQRIHQWDGAAQRGDARPALPQGIPGPAWLYQTPVAAGLEPPRIRLLNPFGVYPELDRFGRTISLVQVVSTDAETLAAQYPEFAVIKDLIAKLDKLDRKEQPMRVDVEGDHVTVTKGDDVVRAKK